MIVFGMLLKTNLKCSFMYLCLLLIMTGHKKSMYSTVKFNGFYVDVKLIIFSNSNHLAFNNSFRIALVGCQKFVQYVIPWTVYFD